MGRAETDFAIECNNADSSQHLRVLVVDDSRFQRRILAASLKGLGYDVVEAGSGAAAMAICRKALPDIVLSDWMMPGMSGLEFCRAFRDLSQDHYAYFIILTSKSDKKEIAQGLDSGADDFLTKPFDGNELRARINAGERILGMQRQLKCTNGLMHETLVELETLYDALDRDLLEAKKLQQSLLRDRHRIFDQGELSLLLRSSGHVGGDLVGYFPAGAGKLGLFAIDVSGHGISSALMTARLAGYLSAIAPEQNVALRRMDDGTFVHRPPKDVIEELNDLVLNEMETEHYFTLMLVIVDMTSGAVTMSQAGHPHPIIHRENGTVEQTGTGGFPVGLLSGVAFQQFETTLTPGDRLLILSDGVTECPDLDGNFLEEEGIEKLMQKLRSIRGPAFLSALTKNLEYFAHTEDFPDDVSAILFDYTGTEDAR